MINSIEKIPIPKIEKIENENPPADAEANEEEILVYAAWIGYLWWGRPRGPVGESGTWSGTRPIFW